MLRQIPALRLPRRLSIRPLRDAILDLAFSASCVGCQAELAAREAAAGEALVCSDCLRQLALFAGPTCAQCGARVPEVARDRSECTMCRGVKLWFDEAIAMGEYAGLLREWLLRMKQGRGDLVSLAIGRLVWERHAGRVAEFRADVVVPVPMHWRRR